IRYLNRLLVSSPVPNPAIWRIVQRRPRCIVGYGPRVNGQRPGSPMSLDGVSATSSGVSTRCTGSPEPVRYSGRASGWRLTKSASSRASQASRSARIRSMAFGSNIRNAFLVEITVVDHALGLEFRARQLARRHQLDSRRDAEPRAQPLPHAGGE